MAYLIVDGKCWAHGAAGLGQLVAWDVTPCRRCGRKLRGRQIPMWFEGELEREAECVDCCRRRHSGCPCGFVLEEAA